jgi:transposase
MQGKKVTEAKLFYEVSLDTLVPEDHIVRRLAEVLDLEYLREMTKCYYARDGKPSVDPVVLFKLYLLGYLFGIASERRLMKEIQVNLAYRWYIGFDLDEALPDHSILTKARYRFPEKVFELVFKSVVRQCQERGLISGKYHFIDSSIVKADVSKASYRAKLMPLKEYIKQMQVTEEQDFAFNGVVDPEKMGGRRKRIGKAQTLQSMSDPEAELISRPGKGTFPAYKAHACVDKKHRVILAISGTRASTDDMREVHHLLTNSIFLTGRKPTHVVADSHYGGVEALKYYQDQEIQTCIRPRQSDSHKGTFKNSQFTKTDNGTGITCPHGQTTFHKIKHRFRVQYRFEEKQCIQCPLRTKCTDSSKGRIVSFYSGNYFTAASDLVESAKGRRLLKLRQTTVEGIWAEAKGFHCLSRCQSRGLSRFKVQLYLTAAAINAKRLLKDASRYRKTGAFIASLTPTGKPKTRLVA